MLRALFPRSHRAYEQSCCAEELEAFGGWLGTAGYSRSSTRGHLFRLRTVLEHADQASPEATWSPGQLRERFAVAATSPSRTLHYRATERVYRRFLGDRGRLHPEIGPRDQWSRLLDPYRIYLVDVRGLVASTVRQHLATVSDFLHRVLDRRRSLRDLTSAHIDRYLALKGSEVGRFSLQHTVAQLRSFFRYSLAHDVIRAPLDHIDTPRTYRGERPPRALPWPLVQRLLRSINRAGKGGWRDYVILHLMAHYGLRPSEIAALRLDSIDWDTKTVRIEQRKTRSALLLPLASRTLAILRRYLSTGRPASTHPELFLRVRCPAGPIKHTGICDLFSKHAERIGLLHNHYSAYSLRHGFAVRLLQRGVGIKAIGDLLGHRSLECTQVYLRLDTEMLRAVALPVPRTRSGRRQP